MGWILNRGKGLFSKPLLVNASATLRMRKEDQSSNLTETSEGLKSKIREQTDDLSVKDEQLKKGVDKQKRSEEQIHIRTKAMDAVADGIFIIDALNPNFPFIYANQSYFKMSGYAKGEIHGKSFFGELLQFRKNGEKYWNLLRITPVRDVSGTITHYVGIKTDITMMRQRDLEIKEQHEELMHVTRVGKLAEFVSSLAHEISQPLTSILSYSQAAQRIMANPAQKGVDKDLLLQEIHQSIVNDDLRATEVIRRLRSLLKKTVPEMKPIDINAVINETVLLITPDLKVRNNVLKIELDSDLPLISGDRIQLQQVLLNLISNSFDAMENNKGPREILIRTSREDIETIMVSVKDSGCGISVQNLPKLFEHFFTSKPDGLGMGLSISRSIVEAHGGHLDVKNNPDRGATFYFTIPVLS